MVAQGISKNGVVSRCLPQMIHFVAFYDMQVHSPRILKFVQYSQCNSVKSLLYFSEIPILFQWDRVEQKCYRAYEQGSHYIPLDPPCYLRNPPDITLA